MAEKTAKTKNPSNDYKATDAYKTFMPDQGLLTKDQHEKLLKGDSVNLSKASAKQMQYLVTNNLIVKGE